jgi:hypothetical protein
MIDEEKKPENETSKRTEDICTERQQKTCALFSALVAFTGFSFGFGVTHLVALKCSRPRSSSQMKM